MVNIENIVDISGTVQVINIVTQGLIVLEV